MFKKNKFPIQLFLIFENLSLIHWTASTLKPNHSLSLWPLKSLLVLAKVTRYELMLSNSYLVDGSVIDTSNYSLVLTDSDYIFKNNKNILFYTFYFYYISYRITFFFLFKWLFKFCRKLLQKRLLNWTRDCRNVRFILL